MLKNNSSQPPLWSVPHQRNKYFTGRDDMFLRLHATLNTCDAVFLTQPVGISGLGGIGKTQMALEYAYRYSSDYRAIFWVRADLLSILISEFVNLARVLALPEKDEPDERVIIEAVLRWLRTHTHWLLILDNADDLHVVEPFLPAAGRGHILFTTRKQSLGGIAQCIEVEKMQPEIGACLLLRRAERIPFDAILSTARVNDQRAALAFSQIVDGLPLALDQAGAYIKQTSCELSDYLALYHTRGTEKILAKIGKRVLLF